MRRVRDRRPAPLFRGTELPRLLTLVVLLGVLLLLMDLARDPNSWRWIAPVDHAAHAGPPGERKQPATQDHSPLVAGSTDLDADEQDAAREEFQAVGDKVPLGPEEMPAYWRLMGWSMHQRTDQMLRRANEKVTFRDLWHEPEKWRGKLVELPVHLRRTATAHDLADNPLGLKAVYEVWGWNSDSQPFSYWMVVPQLPPGMPEGHDIYAEATFVGYFLKLIPYEDRQGKTRATPLLIGRLVWHPTLENPLVHRDEWKWTTYIAGALLLLFAIRWGLTFFGRSKRTGDVRPPTSGDERAVEAWLSSDEPTPSDQLAPEEPPFELPDERTES